MLTREELSLRFLPFMTELDHHHCPCGRDYWYEDPARLRQRKDQLEQCIHACVSALDNDVCIAPGTADPRALDAMLDHAHEALTRLQTLKSMLNGDGTPPEILEEHRMTLAALTLKLEETKSLCVIGWGTRQLLKRLDNCCPWARAEKSLWQLTVEDYEVSRETLPEHVRHWRELRELLVNEDLRRETQRLEKEKTDCERNSTVDSLL